MTLQALSNSSIIDALRKKGFKATPQRIAICSFALGSREHPTVQRIYKEVKEAYPTVSLATVYKTLQILKELRLVQELAFPQGESRFDSYVKPHLNVVCLRCGEVVDINDSSARDLVSRTAAKTGYTVVEQRFDIYGICENCKGRRKVASDQSLR